jgi:hypothetical protein
VKTNARSFLSPHAKRRANPHFGDRDVEAAPSHRGVRTASRPHHRAARRADGDVKSGLSHRVARGPLQLAVLKEYERVCTDVPLARLERAGEVCRGSRRCPIAGSTGSASRSPTAACVVSGAVEYDDRPGPLSETSSCAWFDVVAARAPRAIKQAAVEVGHLRATTLTRTSSFRDARPVLALHHDAPLLHKAGTARPVAALASLS